MIERNDKKRLFLLVDRYLENQIPAWVFRIKYQEFYQLVLSACALSQKEQSMFSLLHDATTKYSEDEEKISQQAPGFFYTKQEFKQEVMAIKQKFIDCWQVVLIDFIKLVIDAKNNRYSYCDGSSGAMDILDLLLESDVGCVYSSPILQNWILDDEDSDAASGNITRLEKDGPYIHLEDLYPDPEEVPIKVTMLRSQLVHLLDEWRDKVCKKRPKEVIIMHENGEFSIETKD